MNSGKVRNNRYTEFSIISFLPLFSCSLPPSDSLKLLPVTHSLSAEGTVCKCIATIIIIAGSFYFLGVPTCKMSLKWVNN